MGSSSSRAASTPEEPHPATFDRRRFLIAAAGAVAWVTLRPHLALARKAARGAVSLQPWNLPPDPPGQSLELARALIGAAVLAPSDWNTQPWRFEVEGSTVRILADPQRALPASDPDQRGMKVSLGAALENLLITARAYGLRPAVTYLPNGGRGGVVAEVSWTAGEARRDRGLFGAIPERRTNRREYDGRGILAQNRALLVAQVPEDLRLHWMEGPAVRELGDLAREAVESQMKDRRTQTESYGWMRFDVQEKRSGDGVPVEALGHAGPARWFSKLYFGPNSRLLGLGVGSAGKQAREGFRSAGAAVLLTAKRKDDALWVMGGQAYERLGLLATQLGIALQPINAPLEMEHFRPEVLRHFGAGGEEPLMLVRLGHAKRPDPLPRRAVSVVASFRTS